MLFKISLSSIRKMMKNYLVLLVGLIISISVFYMFQTLAQNQSFVQSSSLSEMVKYMGIIFHVGSVLLSVITFFYIFYANSFFLSLRQKEFGMYMMLGAKKRKVAQLVVMETLGIGLISLFVGIVAGIGLAALVGKLLAIKLQFPADGFSPFYLPSILTTLIFFLALFCLTSLVNAAKLARYTVLELISEEQQKESVRTKRGRAIAVAIIGSISLALGYFCLVFMKELGVLGFLVATLTTTLGTYLLFMSLLPMFVALLRKNRSLHETGLNSFTLAQLRFRVNSLAKVLATVTMLVALGVGAMSGGLAFEKNTRLITEMQFANDLAIHDPAAADLQALQQMKILEKNEYRYKVEKDAIYFAKDDLLANPPLIKTMTNGSLPSDVGTKQVSEPLPDSLYSLEKEKENSSTKPLPVEWRRALSSELHADYSIFGNMSIRVADKQRYDSLKGSEHKVLVARVDDFLQYRPLLAEMDERQKEIAAVYLKKEPDFAPSKYSMFVVMFAMTSGTMFMGFFLGIAFLAMMASVLMFKILSGASKDINRYAMLRKIGVRKQVLVGSIYKELFAVFLFPMLLGLTHVLIGMNMFSFILVDAYTEIWVPISAFLVIYALYYVTTVQLYKGIVLPKKA